MHRLHLLGRIDLRDARGTEVRVVLTQPKRLALTAYLSLKAADGACRRDELLALFWPELTEERARKALNKAVYFVRHALGEDVLVSRGAEEITVDRTQLWCDATAFVEAVDRGCTTEALKLYRGELLPAFHLDGGLPFEEWLERERVHLRLLAGEAARQRAEECERDGHLTSALAHARRAAELSQLVDERKVRQLLELLDRLGDRAGALHTFTTFAHRLASEYGAEPAAETQALVARIRAPVNIQRRATSEFEASHSTASEATKPPSLRSGGRLAGRPHGPRLVALTALLLIVIGVLAVRLGKSALNVYQVGKTTPIAVGPLVESRPALSPDGKLVAFTLGTVQRRRIAISQVAGGRSLLLTSDLDGDHHRPRWSPDGSRIAFMVGGNGAAYVVPALGGSAKRIIDPARDAAGSFPTWSPDGTRIAYVDGRGLWVRAVEGGPVRGVVEGFPLHSPSWSPDGRYLAYVSGNFPTDWDLSTSSIWTVPVSGGKPTRFSDASYVNVSPTWAPDGNSLLFVSGLGGALDVYQQAVDRGGRPRGAAIRITTGLSPRNITLSADGSRMAYDVTSAQSNIWTASIIGGRVVPLSDARQVTSERQLITCVSISHDGQWLAYDSNRSGNFDIYKVRADGGEPARLTTHPANDFCPTWSPDDRELAFHSTRNETRDIYLVSAEGTNERRVTSGSLQDFFPSWAPDGRRIVYRVRDGNRFFLATVERDVTGGWTAPRELVDWGTERSLIVPRWSPDGKLVAFVARGAVLVIPPEGGAPRVLADSTTLAGEATWVEWSRDASTLYVNVQSPQAFWAVPISTGSPRRVLAGDVEHVAYRGEFATDGRRFFFVMGKTESDVWVMELKTE